MKTEPTHRKTSLNKGIILAVVLLGGAIWLWEDGIKDRVIPKRWGVVEDGIIYRSGQLSSSLVKRVLAEHDIEVIVDLTGIEPGNKDQEAERRAAEELGIEVKRYPLKGDGTGDINHYIDAISAVVDAKQQGRPVLVHCAAGAQRTGGTIAFYRLLVEGKSPSFVVKEMARYDWSPRKDTILLDYLDEHMAEMAEALKARGIIAEIPDPLPVVRSTK